MRRGEDLNWWEKTPKLAKWMVYFVVTVILGIILFGCNPFGVNPEMTYHIQAGEHKSQHNLKIAPKYNETLEFRYTFNRTNFYYDNPKVDWNDKDWFDQNKLYGLRGAAMHRNAYGHNVPKNRALFAWINEKPDSVDVYAYWEIHGGGFQMEYLGTTIRGHQHTYRVSVVGHAYQWDISGDDINAHYRVTGTKNMLAFRSLPWFGGNKPSPQYMYFKITEL